MTRPVFHRLIATALVVGFVLPGIVAVRATHATTLRLPSPPGISPANPMVSGKLVAKATGNSSSGAASCGLRTAAPAVTVNRGLVICTDEGTLVLLQLSRSTGIFNRDWQRIGYAGLALGDRLNAWGTLRDGGTRLYPTVAIQDLSRGGVHVQIVTGRIVAKPDQGPTGRVICGDQDRTARAQTAIVRGLVICTPEGKLVLIQIGGNTKLFTHDRAYVTIEDLGLGDTLTGRGTLQDAGLVINPTISVVDANLLLRGTNSQDFIAGAGPTLTLYVLSSDVGPVQGRVLASPGEPTHVRLCTGAQGTWADLKPGLSVNVSHSIFNGRTMEYVDTSYVSIVSCA
jgi:hypothetical protein